MGFRESQGGSKIMGMPRNAIPMSKQQPGGVDTNNNLGGFIDNDHENNDTEHKAHLGELQRRKVSR